MRFDRFPGTGWAFATILTACAASLACLCLALLAGPSVAQTAPTISFGKGGLAGASSANPTSLQFGPDGRLYVAQQDGAIKAYTVKRNAANDYAVTATETITNIQSIPNHNDDGTTAGALANKRQMTGILVAGTAASPVIYATSSDPRIGAGADGADVNLDTNSGVISKLTKNASGWNKVDLVRGLSRSEENHSLNGMQLVGNTLYVTAGGNTNQGAPSNNFALLPEVALSAAILEVDLGAIGNTTYDLPTLNDPDRPGSPDQGDPFGGNNGENQAKLVPNGPVQVHAPGFRNAYDLVVAESGKMYTIDNGGNAGWGDVPVGEGPGGTCTNAVNEPGASNQDNFHHISGAGYYGGHPNPTRANKANTFGGQSPIEVAANPVECDYNKPASGTLTTFPASTNGMDEYTASNFGGAMKGDLLTAGLNNKIYRVELNGAGTAPAKKSTALFNEVGAGPLDVTAQGDGDPFPGTVWAADIYASSIVVFEPADYDGGGGGTCDPTDPNGDADGDGFTNSDEQANGTDPCSAADVPPDNDSDNISDKTDPDDDNDSQPDTSDPFAVDKNNGKTTNLPLRYTYDPGVPDAGGLEGTFGFTGLMTNGTANYESLYDPDKMTVGGAGGLFTVDAVANGDAFKTSNTQKYGFQSGVNVGPGTGVFTAHTRIAAPFAGITPQNYQSMGLFVGTGDQDNYAKLTVSSNGGTGGVQFAKEVGGTTFTARPHAAVTMPGPESVDLYLTVDPAAKTVQPSYSVTTGGQTGPRTNLGGPEPIPPGWIDGTKAMAAGFISTSRGTAPEFPATWDFMEVVPGNGGTQLPPDSTSEAQVTIDPGGTLGSSSTYKAGSFKVKNTSASGEIKSLKIDLGSSVLPDMVFDPKGTAGDTTAKCFSPDSTTAPTVGLVNPTNPCTSPFSEARDEGYETIEVGFTDFGPGEQFSFAVDVDPTSIKGYVGSGGSGSVSGLELTGAQATVGFEDGGTQTGQTFRIPASPTGSQNTLKADAPAKPTISVLGTQTPAKVQNAQQTVRVSGPAGSKVSLLVLEGAMITAPPGGFYDLDPYEANSVVKVTEKNAAIGTGGTVDVPVTLTKSSTAAGLNYMVAAIKDAVGRTGPNSNVAVLEYGNSTPTDTTPPTVTAKAPNNGQTDVAVGANATATFSEAMDVASLKADGTFTLTEQGAASPVAATVDANASGTQATLDPGADLKPNTTYTAKVATAAKDVAGNALAAPESWTFTTAASSPPSSTYDLKVSANADRSGATALQGATVSGNIYVFTAPDAGVVQVSFWLDDPSMAGTPKRVEKGAPFDFAGGTVSAASPFDTKTLADGEHTMTAKLTLSDGTTEVVNSSFTVDNVSSSAQTEAFQGQNGNVVVEIESAPLAGNWASETEKPDYTGAGYYAWRGANSLGTPDKGILAYKFVADQAGVYKMNIRNRRDKDGRTVANDQENDVWVRLDGGPWTKAFSGTPFDEWGWGTRFDYGHGDQPNATYDLTEGVHTLEISGRSANFKLDRIHLRKSGSPSTTLPESPRTEQ